MRRQHFAVVMAIVSQCSGGTMKPDSQLEKDVMDELRWDPSVSEKEITACVEAGIVTLTGTVPTYAEKIAARSASERVAGVRGVADDVVVAATRIHQRTDPEIA